MDIQKVRAVLQPVIEGSASLDEAEARRALADALLEIAEGIHDLRLAASRQDLRGRGR
jgi:hypothetical protein